MNTETARNIILKRASAQPLGRFLGPWPARLELFLLYSFVHVCVRLFIHFLVRYYKLFIYIISSIQ